MPTFVRTQEVEQRIGVDGRFTLRVTSPDVELRAVDGDTARVRIDFELRAASDAEADQIFERVRFHVRHGDGFVEITEPKRNEGMGGIVRILGMGGGGEAEGIMAEVPAGAEIAYNGVSADLTATGFRGRQEYQTVSGDLVLDRLGGDVRVRGVSSDVSLRADDPVRLEANTVSGDLSAFAPRLDDVRIVTVSGDVELEGELTAQQQHRIETVSGDLSLGLLGGATLEVRGLSTDVSVTLPHRSEGSRDRRRYVVGDGGANLLFSSMSGDVFVRDSRRFSGRNPSPPAPPVPPAPPSAPEPPVEPDRPALSAEEQLAILRALERGEIDVDEATKRLSGGTSDV